MKDSQKYNETDKMVDLLKNNFSFLQVINRFGMSLGFRDKTIKEVCEQNNVDAKTFVVIVNFLSSGYLTSEDRNTDIHIPTLINFLKQSHIFFLSHSLPAIREKLVKAIGTSKDEISVLILRFFDEYTKDVKKHMDYEDKTVFEYASSLFEGTIKAEYEITTFSKHHDQVGEKLTELKNIIIKYCPPGANESLLNDALFDIYMCEEALELHCMVEDYLFVPAILKLEREKKKQ